MDRKDLYKPDINPKDYISEYPDFPKPWISFKDISPLIADADAMRYVCQEMALQCRGADKIVALDARWFIFAPLIAEILEIPWVMCRKKWKLPGEVVWISYGLEYGEDTIEMQKSAIADGEKIAIVDDLLATWGTAMAAVNLVEKLWGQVHNCVFVISLDEEFLLGLESRKSLWKYKCSCVVNYD
jgi:adenine phosphoribosyltransferase